MSFELVSKFEKEVAAFFGAPYAVAVDSCTHGLELCLRLENVKEVSIPKRTYLSVPMLSYKLGISLNWRNERWEDWYPLTFNDPKIIDAAVLWKENSYVSNSFMCLSFQFQKHLSLGRGGMILLDNKEKSRILKKMSYDGREPDIPWRDQNVDTLGYHYYMTPETAEVGLDKLKTAINTKPRKWKYDDWPDISRMSVFVDPYLQTK